MPVSFTYVPCLAEILTMSNATQTWPPDLQAAMLVGQELKSQWKPQDCESHCALKPVALTRVPVQAWVRECVLGGHIRRALPQMGSEQMSRPGTRRDINSEGTSSWMHLCVSYKCFVPSKQGKTEPKEQCHTLCGHRSPLTLEDGPHEVYRTSPSITAEVY